MNLFIGCSASGYIPSKYFDDCKIFLDELFAREHNLIFGASNNGIMGLSYRLAMGNGRKITGVYPKVYESDAKRLNCRKESTETISERTNKLIEYSDALIFLPGGFGTSYELYSAIEFKRGNEFNKPIIIYNSCGYFDKLFEFFELTYDDNFASRKVESCYYICKDATDALRYINSYYGKGGVSRRKV